MILAIKLEGGRWLSCEPISELTATRDYSVLLATRHRWTRPAITPAKQAGTRFIYPDGMARLSWPGWLVICRNSLPVRTVKTSNFVDCDQCVRPNDYAKHAMLWCRAIIDDVGDHAMSEHSVLWSPSDELCWAHVIIPRRTQYPNTSVSESCRLVFHIIILQVHINFISY